MKRSNLQYGTNSTKKPRVSDGCLSGIDESVCQLILSFCDFDTIAICATVSTRFNHIIVSEAFVKRLYQADTGIPNCVVEKTFKSASLALETLHWIHAFEFKSGELGERVEYPLNVAQEFPVSLHNSLDMTDDSLIVTCPESEEDFYINAAPDISSKCPAVVRDVQTLEVLGYLPFQECFASSIFTSKTLGKFLIIAQGRFFFATHIQKNLYDLKDLSGVFLTDIKKKLIYTHQSEIECFSINQGLLNFNDSLCGYAVQLTDDILDARSKVKISEPLKFDPRSNAQLRLSDYDPNLGVLICSDNAGKIFLWYDLNKPSEFETFDLQWTSDGVLDLESLDFVIDHGFFYVSCNNGQYYLFRWLETEKKFRITAEGKEDWITGERGDDDPIDVSLDFVAGRLLRLDLKGQTIRVKNLSDLEAPETVWNIGGFLDSEVWWARVSVSRQPRRVFLGLSNGDFILWDMRKFWRHANEARAK
jgi:hypothetical protein